ncbi:DNA-binding response regulator [Siminovitchia terrae]|uniref:DNA-binding response regulator n=1 Tax=Siminovitchia terrae TaxID=1914933 RepID=A0ABQ4L365_SIMTE|nr:response regulator transcription factor [Siminovitchia terrae]GIN94082.1 DNA-binding response regulator [Siminovitchia terrae]GIN98321.1 DNA-binding response regulator [Siminovitchia terrae]
MTDDANILIVDDEIGILKMLEITLQKEHFKHITTATTKAAALQALTEQDFDIILLDVMLPDGDGFALCSAIRQQTTAPILFISARSSDFDKLTGLSVGGDDYITKPFNPLEVVARIRAILRRQREYEKKPAQSEMKNYVYNAFSFSPDEALLTVHGEVVQTTAKELELLHFFCENPNRVFTTSQIYERVWGEDVFGEEKTVTIHIAKLRKKLGDNTRKPKIIVNLRGIGYKFIPPTGDA